MRVPPGERARRPSTGSLAHRSNRSTIPCAGELAFAQRAARQCTSQPMLVHNQRAVDQHEGDAFGWTLRGFVRCSIAHVLGIEGDHISGGTRTQRAAVEEAESRCWLTRQLADHLLQPDQPELAYIHAEIPGERSPGARMRTVTDHDSIAARHVRWVLEDGPYVFLVAGENQRAHAELVSQQQVAVEVERTSAVSGPSGGVSDVVSDKVAVLRM